MKNFLLLLVPLSLLFACKPETNKLETTVELTGIALSEHRITLKKEYCTSLSVRFTPTNATNKTVTWDSSQPAIATVSNGWVYAGATPGEATIIAKSGNFMDECLVTVVSPASSVSLNKKTQTMAPGERVTLSATVSPSDATDKLEWSSSNLAVANVQEGVVTAIDSGIATITVVAGSKNATCEIEVKKPFAAVDMGLSVKWANANIGADSDYAFGDYYAWGETETKTSYLMSNYKWGSIDYHRLTKYNTSSSYGPVDNKVILEPEDDIAHIKLGGKWRMPTYEEFLELKNKCEWEWGFKEGNKGMFVTAPNGNSLFFPCAGCYRGSRVNNSPWEEGHYWSSSLVSIEPERAYQLRFGYNYVEVRRWDSRDDGHSIRAVLEE